VRAAYAARAEWSRLPPLERAAHLARYARVLEDEAERLAALVHAEEGKPLAEARAEVGRAVEVVAHFAG
jgi:acyl-CoA reductase-like NAD-dependent aldehyde dehydrogenase